MTDTSEWEVFLKKTSPASLKDDVRSVLKETYLPTADPGKKTLIKINGNYDREYPGSDTSSWFLDALLAALKEFGFSDVVVVEGDGSIYSAEKMIKDTGLIDICNKHEIPFQSYEHQARDADELPLLLEGAQLINVPVFHTHGVAIISCAVKNLFGLLPKSRWVYHECLNEKLIELYDKVKPVYTIVDGTVGMKGDSTRRGDPVQVDLIAAGWDMLDVDLVASKVMGYQIDEIPLLKFAKDQGILTKDRVHVTGDLDWETAPSFDFTFGYSGPKKFSLWLQRHKTTKKIIEWKPVFAVFHKVRGAYEAYYFHKKRKRIFAGPWMEYKKYI